MVPTSKKPCIKLAGNLASGFSSSRKNFMTCGICFQKFNVSYHHTFISIDAKSTSQESTSCHPCISPFDSMYPYSLPRSSINSILSYLKLRMAMKKQHIHHRQLINISMSLKLLPYFRSYLRDRHIKRVHLLDLGRLASSSQSAT